MAQWSRQVEDSIRIASVTPQTFCGTPDVSPVIASTHRGPWHSYECRTSGNPRRNRPADTDTVVIGRKQSGKRRSARDRKNLSRFYNQKTHRPLKVFGESHYRTRNSLDFQSILNECSLCFKSWKQKMKTSSRFKGISLESNCSIWWLA